MKLSEIAMKNGYSKEFCHFLASFFIMAIPPIDDNYDDPNFIEALVSRKSEETILKIILGCAKENEGLKPDIFNSQEEYEEYEKNAEEQTEEYEIDLLEYYSRHGEEEYKRHCNKDGTFRYADFINRF